KRHITYRITRPGTREDRLITRDGAYPVLARDDGDFLYMFEKDMTIEAQKLRSDLYFVHAAVVELDGHALALVAPSGYGKSTTTWGLLHHGFKDLSDELAPVHLTAMQVHPFPTLFASRRFSRTNIHCRKRPFLRPERPMYRHNFY